MSELSNYTTLSGSIRVFDGSLSKTQFEEIWDRIEERVNSDLMPEYAIIDNALDFESTNPVENRVITVALDDVYHLFPTTTISGDSTNNTITIEDGANGVPLDNLVYEIPPQQNGSGTPSPDTPRTFNYISNFGMFGVAIYDENNTPIDEYAHEYSLNRNDIYAGRIDLKLGKLYKYAYYPDYNGEVAITGPWVSSQAVYETDTEPPIGSQVIDLGNVETEIELGELAKSMLKELGTRSNKMVYSAYGTGDFSISYRADPKAYTDLAVGLTASQRQALIDLLDD